MISARATREDGADPVEPGRRAAAGRGRTSPQTLVEYATEEIRESILSRALPPASWIRVDAFARKLGVSRIPVREALRGLATEGLVVPQPHRGYTVAEATVTDLEEAYHLRLTLEPMAVRQAVPNLSDAQLRNLDLAADAMAQAFRERDWAAYRSHHKDFHFGIYGCCGSTWLRRFAEMLWLNTQRYQRMSMEMRSELQHRTTEHKRILAACRRHDADLAASLMHSHLANALDSLREFLVRNGELSERTIGDAE